MTGFGDHKRTRSDDSGVHKALGFVHEAEVASVGAALGKPAGRGFRSGLEDCHIGQASEDLLGGRELRKKPCGKPLAGDSVLGLLAGRDEEVARIEVLVSSGPVH